METNDSDKNLDDWIIDLQDPSISQKTIDLLKNTSNDNEEIAGLKWFLAKHDYDISMLNDFLDSLKGDFKSLTQHNSHNSKNYWKIAVSFALLIVGTASIVFLSNRKSAFEQYDFNDPGLPVVLSDNKQKELQDWMTEFKSENYKEVITHGEKLLQNDQKNDTILYYLGYTYCKSGDFKRASNLLGKVSTRSIEIKEKALFVHALCTMETNKETAKKELQKIANDPNNRFYLDAKKLISKF